MSEQTERVIPFAFHVVDAAFFEYFQLGKPRSTAHRTALTSGSARYVYSSNTVKDKPAIVVRAVGTQQTQCFIESSSEASRTMLTDILELFIILFYREQAHLETLIARERERFENVLTDTEPTQETRSRLRQALNKASPPIPRRHGGGPPTDEHSDAIYPQWAASDDRDRRDQVYQEWASRKQLNPDDAGVRDMFRQAMLRRQRKSKNVRT